MLPIGLKFKIAEMEEVFSNMLLRESSITMLMFRSHSARFLSCAAAAAAAVEVENVLGLK